MTQKVPHSADQDPALYQEVPNSADVGTLAAGIGQQAINEFHDDTAGDRIARSKKSRTEKPAIYPERFPVPDDKASWSVEYAEYAPEYFVADSVLANDVTKKKGGWADPEDITLVSRKFTSYEGEVKFDSNGYPINPYTRTGIEGRGLLGKYATNFTADSIVTRINPDTGIFQMAAVYRGDTGEPAIPGGMVDDGHDVSLTLEKEFEEETGESIDMSKAQLVYRGYVDNPRNTDNAWIETTAKHLHLTPKQAEKLTFKVVDPDEVRAVEWFDITEESIGLLYASHSELVTKAVKLFLQADKVKLDDSVRKTLEKIAA